MHLIIVYSSPPFSYCDKTISRFSRLPIKKSTRAELGLNPESVRAQPPNQNQRAYKTFSKPDTFLIEKTTRQACSPLVLS